MTNMEYAIAAMFFALGAVTASFIGVVVARLSTGHSAISGRSSCDACGSTLTYETLIPIFSFFILGGRANCCGARLAISGPISEIVLGVAFVLAYYSIGLTPALASMFIALALLLALVAYDLAHQILPTSLLALFTATSAITGYMLSTSFVEFVSTFVVALVLGLFLLSIHLLSRGRAMGFSDAPLCFALALLVGEVALSGFIYSFWIGGAVGIFILLMRPRGSRMRVEVPFAPFLAAGFLLAYFTQWNLVAWLSLQ